MTLKNVLIVEDNQEIAHLIEMHLSDMECQAVTCSDGLTAVEYSQKQNFDLIILDLMLPRMDGLEVCRNIRQQSHYTPILMLTSRSSELDRVLGLEVGADDYVTKPFSIRELIARVKAQFRREDAFVNENKKSSNNFQFGNLCIDVERRHVSIEDRNIDLTAKEFDLLLKFTENPGQVYSRAQLLDSVWGYGHDGYEHTVNSHINRLRNKIEHSPAEPEYIITVWGVGYKFNDALKHVVIQ